jgi:hypothetical protein
MMLKRIQTLLEHCSDDKRHFPPTTFYNEGWMMRLVIDWFARNKTNHFPLTVPQDSTWYSEALLLSTFLPRYRGDKYSELWTHADGAIGHFEIGRSGDGDLSILSQAKHFVIVEAKMFSELAPGVKNANYYNQAARNVACIAEVLRKGNKKADELISLGFYVLAPKSQINKGVFKQQLKYEDIKKTVQRRIQEYKVPKEDWWNNWFLPTIKKIEIQTVSWEDVIIKIKETDISSGQALNDFYNLCLKFNQSKKKRNL